MRNQLCIHGHFYQPPREDPWVDKIMPEGSAAPMRHWNERIARESYGPLAWCRILDSESRISEIVNVYEWISFNFGPTLLSWMERADPATYARVLEGDRAGVERLGHGNALAQIYHHVIMPLASPLDKEVEVAWAVADFKARFGRRPEGMWLSETAVDTATLEVLAAASIRFTLLAPRQAREVLEPGETQWRPVDEAGFDIFRPYRVDLPSGRSMAVFFYDGPLSQAVAFERLLEDGERFWQRISAAFPKTASTEPARLLSLGTDGETYGHHFHFGEMALGYVLGQARLGRDEIAPTNFGAYLAEHPPKARVRLHEPSSWSCAHGVERWRANCGCTTGGHPGWNQRWRGPLRQGLNRVKQGLDAHFFAAGKPLFEDPRQALLDYGHVLAGAMSQDEFAAGRFKPGLDRDSTRTAWRLLAMQQWGLASQASCAWFFEELSRIEPLNAMTYALRAMELARRTGGPDLESPFAAELAEARSNYPDKGTGKDLFLAEVKPRQESDRTLIGRALLSLWAEARLYGRPEDADPSLGRFDWPAVSVTATCHSHEDEAALKGTAELVWRLGSGSESFAWEWRRENGDAFRSSFLISRTDGDKADQRGFSPRDLPWNKRQAIAMRMISHAEEQMWQERLALALEAAPLFLSWQEGQITQNAAPEWAALWPALAWGFVLGLPQVLEGSKERLAALRDFLRQTGRGHADATMAARRVAAEALGLLQAPGPKDLAKVRDMASRARDLELPMDWWSVQNRLWELCGHDPCREAGFSGLAETLGFAV